MIVVPRGSSKCQIIYNFLGVPDDDAEELSKSSTLRSGTSGTARETSNT